MKNYKTIFLATAALTIALNSCKKEGCTDETAINYDSEAEKDDNSCEFETPNTCDPSTYCFLANDEFTVSFGGQTTRLNHLEEMTPYMKPSNNGEAVSAAQLREMFSNNNGTGSSFFSADAIDASKQLKNKTFPAFTGYYENLMDEMEVASQSTSAGSNGTAGVVVSTTNPDKKYLLNENGFEYTQLIEKGLMGDVFYFQAMETYISGVEDQVFGNQILEGKTYTENEHKFDEAFGYFGIPVDFNTNTEDVRFHGNYCNSRNSVLGTNDIFNLFVEARGAVSNQHQDHIEMVTPQLRTEWHRVIAGTAIHYLNSALADFQDPALKCHVLSEAYAFIGNLVHSDDAYNISITQRDECLALLGDNFYDTSIEQINAAKQWLVENTAITLIESADL